MKKYLPIIALVLFSCSNQSQEENKNIQSISENQTREKSDSTEVVNLVHEFFKSFDEKDLEKMKSILTPTSKIIHHNGVATDTKEMIEIISNTKNWYPRKRSLTEFEITSNSNIAIVGLLNEVTFMLPENREVYEPYNETWIFEKIENSWYPTRIHYSKIIQDEHTEVVE